MREVISSRVPKFEHLPTSITNDAVNAATLPVKIEAARQAIAACTDLPELLRYKDQAEGIAAAVRTMKKIGPEIIRKANEMMADAWMKGGELLSQYSNVPPPAYAPKGIKIGEKGFKLVAPPSPRGEVIKQLGIPKYSAMAMVRLSAAPTTKAYEAVKHTASLRVAARSVPALHPEMAKGTRYDTDAGRDIMRGLLQYWSAIKNADLRLFSKLSPDDKRVIKAKITEMVELLDEMDRLCR